MASGINHSRRNLLRGRPPDATEPVRPPFAVTNFSSACTECGDCIAACPERIIVRGSGRYPELDFRRGECTFCGDCVRSCAEDALSFESGETWNASISISDACLTKKQVICRSCGDECEATAISFPPRLGAVSEPLINDDDCTGCGACVSACPQVAIEVRVLG